MTKPLELMIHLMVGKEAAAAEARVAANIYMESDARRAAAFEANSI